MGRTEPHKISTPVAYHCCKCNQPCNAQAELVHHTAKHTDCVPAKQHCLKCDLPSDGSRLLEAYELHTEQGELQSGHEGSNKSSLTSRGLEVDMKRPLECRTAFAVPSSTQLPDAPLHIKPPPKHITCDRCPDTFTTQRDYNEHRAFPHGRCADHKHKRTPPGKGPKIPQGAYVGLGKPNQTKIGTLNFIDTSEYDEPHSMGAEEEYCSKCRAVFASQAEYVRHALPCSMRHGFEKSILITQYPELQSTAADSSKASQPHPSSVQALSVEVPTLQTQRPDNSSLLTQTVNLNIRLSVPTQRTPPRVPDQSPPPSLSSNTSLTTSSGPFSFLCRVNGCGKTFRSEAGLKVHEADTHGIGGRKLDMLGTESWMLGQRERDRLRAEGLLGNFPLAPVGRGRSLRPTPTQIRPLATPSPAPNLLTKTKSAPMPKSCKNRGPPRAPVSHGLSVTEAAVPRSMNMGGVAEMDQAKFVQSKTLRLLIQSDIFIKHDGIVTVCGIDWTRIGVLKQPHVVDLFESMCHLPKIIQTEYLPPPKTFKDEYSIQYPVTEFKHSPDRDSSKLSLDVIVLSCSKVVLAGGCQEVVKVAAIDLITCRILMNHLVCTDPNTLVSNWVSSKTGIISWADMEGARQAGYKIFKGWSAARSALWRFVDKDTIIVGHNLRSDLDALRIIHGRAVDVAKVVEKAAKGPLSKTQLSLDSLCRNYPGVHLRTDPKFGRDCLMNVFAARELGLWIIKNQEALDKDMKQKSLDYQKMLSKGTA